jgi:hypothetical protein
MTTQKLVSISGTATLGSALPVVLSKVLLVHKALPVLMVRKV